MPELKLPIYHVKGYVLPGFSVRSRGGELIRSAQDSEESEKSRYRTLILGLASGGLSVRSVITRNSEQAETLADYGYQLPPKDFSRWSLRLLLPEPAEKGLARGEQEPGIEATMGSYGGFGIGISQINFQGLGFLTDHASYPGYRPKSYAQVSIEGHFLPGMLKPLGEAIVNLDPLTD